MVSDQILIFANPIAGRGRGAAMAGRLKERLSADGWDARTVFNRPDQITDADASPDAHAVIAIGGDGTLRAVATRFYRTTAPMPPLLVVPMGTANLMGRHLGIRWDDPTLEADVSAAIRRHRVRSIDAGSANGKLFLLMVGIGLDGRIVHELDRIRRGPIRYASYVWPAAQAVGFYDYPSLTITVDGQLIAKNEPAMAFVGNVKEYGTGFPLLPSADPTDGLLDVCVIPCRSWSGIVRMFLHAAAGDHLHAEGVKYIRGKVIHIDSPTQVPVQVDGEAFGHTPLEIGLLPVKVPFIVPV